MSKQNLIIVIVGAALIGAFAFLGVPRDNEPSTDNGVPVVEVSSQSHDFGTIKASDGFAKTIFTIKNTGDSELKIARVTTSCSCTTASVEDKQIAPGEETELRVAFDPNYHKNAFGPMLREVYIRSNDPKNPETVLELKGVVVE